MHELLLHIPLFINPPSHIHILNYHTLPLFHAPPHPTSTSTSTSTPLHPTPPHPTPPPQTYKGARVNVGFRYNLFDHIGAVSTLRPEVSTAYPACYDELLVPTVFEVSEGVE